MALTQLYAIQRRYVLKYWQKNNDSPLDDFALKYKPEFKFHKGMMKLNHCDLDRVHKTATTCGLCFCCDILTSGLKDSADDQLLIFIKRKKTKPHVPHHEHPSSLVLEEDDKAETTETSERARTAPGKTRTYH